MDGIVGLSQENHKAVKKVEDNSETPKLELTRKGFCRRHIDVQLRVKKLFGYRILRDNCPKCTEEIELEKQETRLKLMSDGLASLDGGAALAALLGQGNKQSDNTKMEIWPGGIQKGMHVRCVSCSRGASSVSIGDVGVVKSLDDDGDYVVDFPKQDNWYGRPSDIVIDNEAEKVRPGALVTVKDCVTEPRFKWGNFEPGMHGIVMKVEHDGRVIVQCGFLPSADPKEGLFNSQLQELRVVDDGSFTGAFRGKWSGSLQLGQAVRVPASLDTPSTGWGSLKRDEIGYVRGFVEDLNLYVCDFPSVDGWKGRAGDLEVDPKATLIRPGKQVRVREGITPKYGWGSVTSSSVGTVLSCSYDGRVVIVKFKGNKLWLGNLEDLEVHDSTREAEELFAAFLRTVLGAAGSQQSDNDATEIWPGEIQKGMHVRCVSCSRGASSVSIGDVGVVKSRDDGGDYVVDFPKQDNWRGRPSDIVIDNEAEKVRPGALVTVKDSVTEPLSQWGSFERGMHGIVIKVEHDGRVTVQCGFLPSADPKEGLFNSQLQELRVVDDGSFTGTFRGKWSGRLQLGQAVRVPASLDVPSTGWGSLKRDEIGYVRGFMEQLNLYVCDFPSVDGWKGRAGDLEVDPKATLIRPGKQVRVREGVTPKYGWGSVTSSSVGTVLSCSHDGRVVVVQFPEDLTWKGNLADLEICNGRSCAGGHGLKLYHTMEDHSQTCDFCGTTSGPARTLMYGCRQCNMDACLSCYTNLTDGPVLAAATAEPFIATAVPVTATAEPDVDVPIVSVHKFAIGSTVIVTGLCSCVQYNGSTAEVVDIVEDRYVVKITISDNAEKVVKVKEGNLVLPRPMYEVGTFVKLCALEERAELNGMITHILGFDSDTGHYLISMKNSSTLKVLANNFEVIEEVEDIE